MTKEQLEKIKEHFAYCMDEGLLFTDQEEKFLEILYEQAERVQELENKYKLSEGDLYDLTDRHKRVKQQNKRYRDFIETASDPWEVAKEIGRNIVSAAQILTWIEREANNLLEGESSEGN